jgi:hypothetical protein
MHKIDSKPNPNHNTIHLVEVSQTIFQVCCRG